MAVSVVHVVAGLWKDTGGPAEVIPNLCRAQADAGAHVTLCTIDGDLAPQVKTLRESGVELQVFPAVDDLVRFSPSLRSYLLGRSDIDVVHNHGHWLYPNWCAASVARRRGLPFVTTPHGTLVAGMLSRSRFKKRLAWALFDRHLIRTASLIHTLSEAERDATCATLGPAEDRLVVIPNGVGVPTARSHGFEKKGMHEILFLSRLTEIKGILELLSAWREVEAEYPNVTLRLVGPLDQRIREPFERLLKLCRRATYHGPAYGDDRWDYYRSAAGFVLPTHAEGLPTVLLEAAAHGLPILTTAEANFPELASAGGCLISRPDRDSLAASLRIFLAMDPNQLDSMRRNAEQLISERYSWGRIASQWLTTYEGLAHRCTARIDDLQS